jgi:hypothetical protein
LYWRILGSFWVEKAERASDKDNKQAKRYYLQKISSLLLVSWL